MKQGAMGAAPYRGEDRRQRGAIFSPADRKLVGVVVAGLLALAILVTAGPLITPELGDPTPVDPLLDSAALAVAMIIGLLCLVRWRLVGQADSLWLAGAVFVFALGVLLMGRLLPVVLPADSVPEVLQWLQPAARLVALGMLVQALRTPEVDAHLSIARVTAIAVAGVGTLTVLFQLMPAIGRLLAGADDTIVAGVGFPVGSPVLIAAYGFLAVRFFLLGRRLPRPLYAWFGVLLLALALAEAHRLLPADSMGYWGVGDGLLRFAGLLAGVTGATRDLVTAYGEQGGRLLESVATGMTAEARMRAEQAANEERAHEARNALTAIEGATRTLEHYRDRLDPETRASLTEAISGEIARLQQLVSVERTRGELHPFKVERALRHVITSARADGMEVEVDIDVQLTAFGRGAETAEVVQNLIVNARRYAPGSPVHLRAHHQEGGVIIRVEDRGPGVEESERRLIFSRGTRGSAASRADGSGLGLYVSLELMREQMGDLWVQERPGGGASFALWLPSPPEEVDTGGTETDGGDALPSRLRPVTEEGGHKLPEQGFSFGALR